MRKWLRAEVLIMLMIVDVVLFGGLAGLLGYLLHSPVAYVPLGVGFILLLVLWAKALEGAG